jgi:two-component system, NarL family, response regulator LiaR
MQEKIRVLLVEDEMIVRDAVSALLALQDEITIVGEATTAAQGVQLAKQLRPDVALVDLRLPDKRGTEVIHEILAKEPQTRILVFTAFANERELALAFAAGASGYVCKTQSIYELVQAIHAARRGQHAASPAINETRSSSCSSCSAHTRGDILSEAERRVLALVAQGLTNKEIATQLGISAKTIECHIGCILSKLRLNNRTQAALYALKYGLAPQTHLAPSPRASVV